MIRDAVAVRLSPEERAVLEAKLRAPTTEQRQVFRARIVLLAAEERSTRSIARELGTMPRTVSGWRGRFAREGLAGLEDRPHPGPASKYDSATGRRILALLDEPPPNGYARGRCWPRPWAMCMSSRSGTFCAPRRSTFRGVNRGAKATIPNSPPKPPMSLGSISRRRENAIVI